ncbi:MAG: 2,3-bisphosphoglycerate-independent phosphoglycerate mutase, partial [Thermoleophilia bacterium]|nr:2,3-bisphosphoglycerate-independent phosphoglycerate mutase [Thermoleophilia bacterium]
MSRDGVRPVALIILDGWGQADESPGNAVRLARTPTFDRLWDTHPHTLMSASGLDVGLPEGQMGNSEVGHLNLGAGRVVYQDLTRIDKAVVEGELRTNENLVAAIDTTLASGGALHVVGLCSHGGVHSSLMHIGRIVWQCAEAGIPRVLVHAITDGRDVGPDSALTDIPEFANALATMADKTGVDVHIATVTGRYWAMDRDQRWDRTHKAWEAIVHGSSPTTAGSPEDAVRAAHAEGITDEFVEPTIIGLAAPIVDGDSVIFANFRPDRMRQLVHAFADGNDFAGFDRGRVPQTSLTCMCEYDEKLGLPLLFSAQHLTDTLADVLEREQLVQLHVAETEKYAHVTYFFNGGVELVHKNERRELVSSAREVATYDLKPEMSSVGVGDAVVAGVERGDVDFVIVNFANPDMVGHSGSLPAAIAACEATDLQLARVVQAVTSCGGACFITADHGNAEVML